MLQVCGFDLRPCRAKHLRAVCDGEIVCVCACCRSGTVNGTFLFGVTKWASWVVLVVKNPPANAGDLRDMGLIPEYEDPLKESTATHSSVPAWTIPWTEEPGRLWSIGCKESDTTEAT